MWKRLPHLLITTPLFGSLSLAACSFVVDPARPQCTTNRDCSFELSGSTCVSSLCEIKPEWTCLEAIEAPGTGLVNVNLPTVEMVERRALPGIEGSLCRKLDVTCSSPLASVVSGPSGNFELSLPSTFDGFLEIPGPERVPVLYFFGGRLSEGEVLPPVALLDASSMSALASEIDAELRPDRGMVLVTTQDCFGAYSAGIHYESDEADAASVPFYATDGLPSVVAAATDATGYGGFINLRPGTARVAGSFAEGAMPLASASLLVREGTITHGRITPHGFGASGADP